MSFGVYPIYTQLGSLNHAQYLHHKARKQHMPRLGLTARERLSRSSNERVQTYTVQWWPRFPTRQNTLKNPYRSKRQLEYGSGFVSGACRGRAKGALENATNE